MTRLACRSMGGLLLALTVMSVDPLHGVQDFEWSGRLARGHTIEVKGIIGDIRAVPARGDQVEVTAVLREGRRGYADEIDFDVIEHGDGITICAVYPSDSRGSQNECRSGDRGRNGNNENDTRVDFTVRVPADIFFVGRTVTGDVDARGLTQDVEAYTVTGDIDVETDGFVRAQTVTGSINAELGRADWRGELEFKTVTGRITVSLPDGTGADVRAKTVTGAISTDFPLRVRGRFMSKSVSGTIGDGGRGLNLETVTGSISLRRQGF